MSSYRETRVLPYPVDRLFDLIADVERYPEFLPWWHAARVRRRDGNTEYVDQVVGPAIARFRFSSTTVLERPDHIKTTSKERPFRCLEINWTFAPAPQGGCAATFAVDYELRSAALHKLIGVIFEAAVRRVVSAFERRAGQVLAEARVAGA
jgi:coenzyme Q-binding protein COQ10